MALLLSNLMLRRETDNSINGVNLPHLVNRPQSIERFQHRIGDPLREIANESAPWPNRLSKIDARMRMPPSCDAKSEPLSNVSVMSRLKI
jgi:hypothetical protein